MAMDDPISDRQLDWIVNMLENKDLSTLDPTKREWLTQKAPDSDNYINVERMTKGAASQAIEDLRYLKRKPEPAPQKVTNKLPAGFAHDHTTAPQDTETELETYTPSSRGYYFLVDPTTKEEIFVRITLDIQASDDFYPIKNPARQHAIISEIGKNPIQATNEYGIKLGRCGICNRTLTARDSRLRGIGPICAQKLDSIPSPEDIEALKELGLI